MGWEGISGLRGWCEREGEGGQEEKGADEPLDHDAFAELTFLVTEPMANEPNDDDAPDAAGVVEDVRQSDFVEESDAGGDTGGLEGEG